MNNRLGVFEIAFGAAIISSVTILVGHAMINLGMILLGFSFVAGLVKFFTGKK